jgi:DNA polymerase-3 subunit beta
MAGSFSVGREPFAETLNRVGRAASHDETRPILTGVLVSIADDILKMVATDSYRLAVKETRLDQAVPEGVEAIVPVRALHEVARLATAMGPGEVETVIGESQALFRLAGADGDVWVASRIIDGQFPNYRQLIPDTFERELSLPRDAFMAAARRVSLLAQKSIPLRLSFSEGTLTLKALTQDIGQAEEVLDVDFSGEPFEIGFSPAYLIEGIDAVDDAVVRMRFTTPLRPGLIDGGGTDFVYLIMPIRLSS